MNEHNFKVGDIVQRIHDVHMGMKVGDISTVISTSNSTVRLKDFGGDHSSEKLKLIKDNKTKAKINAPFKFLLQYDRDADPLELFKTMPEVIMRVRYLIENDRYVKKESFKVYTISGLPKKIKISTAVKVGK